MTTKYILLTSTPSVADDRRKDHPEAYVTAVDAPRYGVCASKLILDETVLLRVKHSTPKQRKQIMSTVQNWQNALPPNTSGFGVLMR